jgi:hemolysin activation/secretion protein
MLALTIAALGAELPVGHLAYAQLGAGQVAPPSSPIERVLPEAQPQAQPRLLQPPAPAPAGPEGGPPVTLRSVEITGATEYSTAELAGFYAGIVGQTVPQDRVANVVRDIQTKYRNDGYFLTVVRGAIEPEDAGPVLRIRVIEGFISDVKLEGDIGPASVLVYRFLEKLTHIRPTNISDIERALLLIQGIPGVSARAVLRPGAGEVGAVELIAQVGRKAFGGIVNYDNRGSTYAGTGELLISADANSFTSLGERTELTVFDTPWNDEQVFTQLSSEAFIGSDGLKVKGYYGQGLSEPGSFLATTGFKSHLVLAGVSASYPIIRTRPLSLTSNLAFDASRSIIDEFGADNIRDPQSVTNLRILRAGGNVTFQDDTFGLGQIGANSFTGTIHKGIVGLGSSRNSSPLPARVGNVIDFLKYTTELTRVQNLFEYNDFLFALKLSMAGQYTDDVLPPNEKFFLGGTQYGRGFFSGEITGDRAIGGTVEFQANTTVDGIFNANLQYYVFYDTGQTWDLAPGDLSHHLQSVGLGLRVDLTPALTGELEVTKRYTLNPSGTNTTPERPEAVFVRLVGRF